MNSFGDQKSRGLPMRDFVVGPVVESRKSMKE
jgi:hypothetical protein